MLLHYKIPREPSASRVAAWRKLKRMGAVLLHDSVWVLAAEILEQGSEALVWQARFLLLRQDEELPQCFLAQVEDGYRVMLEELSHGHADLSELARRYQSLRAQDYFHSELGQRVRQALLDAAATAPSGTEKQHETNQEEMQ